MENIRERFGILIRPTGRFEVMQLGFECKEQPIESAVSKYFGAGIEYHKTADEMHIYIERQGAQDEGCIKNEAASWLANTSLFGDVIVLPRKKQGKNERCGRHRPRTAAKYGCAHNGSRSATIARILSGTHLKIKRTPCRREINYIKFGGIYHGKEKCH